MEQSSVVDVTLRTYERLRAAGHSAVGTVLQSYLYRTDADLDRLLPRAEPPHRQGRYLEPPEIAYGKRDVDRAYLRLVEHGLREGAYIAVATHDTAIIERVKVFAEPSIGRDRFEFQMLYGVRSTLQRALVGEGYKVLVATHGLPTSVPMQMRRLAKRPANVGFFVKNAVRREGRIRRADPDRAQP